MPAQAPPTARPCPGPDCSEVMRPGAMFCPFCYQRLPRSWRDELQTINRRGGPDRRRLILRLRSQGIAFLATHPRLL